MPELPEVETTRRGIAPHLEGRAVKAVVVRQRRLRWPIPRSIQTQLPGRRIERVERRAKYLLLRVGVGDVILHLGMSGSLRVLPTGTAAESHDHFDLQLVGGQSLRLRDPRRFGAVLWARGGAERHPLLADLGPEPLGEEFDGERLYQRSRGRRAPLRNFLLDGRVVAGVGNIYANEAAFRAGIHPTRAAGRISRQRYQRLAAAIREVLAEAIAQGGTTLRDFTQSDGKPGYFRISLAVYGRAGERCRRCDGEIRRQTVSARSLFWCPSCQR